MKYCPYCGAVLVNGEAPFCSECGESLIGAVPAPVAPGTDTKANKKEPDKHSRKNKKQRKGRRTDRSTPSPQSDETAAAPTDDGYDGYYDDVLPADEGSHGEGIDKELAKKIAALIVGMLLVIAACVALMYLL